MILLPLSPVLNPGISDEAWGKEEALTPRKCRPRGRGMNSPILMELNTRRQIGKKFQPNRLRYGINPRVREWARGEVSSDDRWYLYAFSRSHLGRADLPGNTDHPEEWRKCNAHRVPLSNATVPSCFSPFVLKSSQCGVMSIGGCLISEAETTIRAILKQALYQCLQSAGNQR
jgi:hypothetical protein